MRDLALQYVNSIKSDLPTILSLFEALSHGRLTVSGSADIDDADVR